MLRLQNVIKAASACRRKWRKSTLSSVSASLLTIGLFAVTACNTAEKVRASKAHDDAGAYTEVQGVSTYYVHKGAGHPVILIHGLAASTFSFRNNIDQLSDNFDVYALDLKGFGASDKPLFGYGLDDFREQVRGFMDNLNLRSAHVIGNSMGGEVALRLALAYPERVDSLVLVDSAGFMRWIDAPLGTRVLTSAPVLGEVLTAAPFLGEFLTAPLQLEPQVTRGLMARYLRRLYYDPTLVSSEVVDGYYRPLATPAGNRGLLNRLRAHDWGGIAERIPEIAQPTLVVWGSEDRLIPVEHAERFRRALPHAEVIIYPECGHHPQAEVPELFNRDVSTFLEAHS